MASVRPAACGLSAAAALLALAPLAAQGPAPVRCAPVVVRPTQDMESVTGNLRARSRAAVAAQEAGRVVEVLVNEAQTVAEGEVLARLDRRRLERDLAEAEAERDVAGSMVAIRQAEVATAEKDLESYRRASSATAGSVSALTLRAAELALDVARARQQSAERDIARLEARVARFRIRLSDTEVRAPFAGRVVVRSVEPGEWVDPGSPIVTLVSVGAMEAWIEVPERVPYEVLEQTETLRVRVETLGMWFTAGSLRIVPDVDPRARRYFAVAEILPNGHTLAAGMSLTALVPGSGFAERPIVPSDAVLRDGGGYFVYVARPGPDGSHTAVPASVEVAYAASDSEVVLRRAAGLTAGDLVVVEGNERLRPGAPVRVLPGTGGAGGSAPAGGSPEAEVPGGGSGGER